MPFVNLTTVKGLLNAEQKQTLIDKLTELLVEVEGGGNPEFRKMVWICLQECEPESWGLGELRPTAASIAQFVAARDAQHSAT